MDVHTIILKIDKFEQLDPYFRLHEMVLDILNLNANQDRETNPCESKLWNKIPEILLSHCLGPSEVQTLAGNHKFVRFAHQIMSFRQVGNPHESNEIGLPWYYVAKSRGVFLRVIGTSGVMIRAYEYIVIGTLLVLSCIRIRFGTASTLGLPW